MPAVTGSPFTVTMLDGYPLSGAVGARVEVPVTRAIASYWKPAVKADNGDGTATWSALMDGIVDPGTYEIVWRNDQTVSWEVFVPLSVVQAGTTLGLGTDFPDADPVAVRPGTDDVAALERNRTIAKGGGEVGVFTADTKPTDTEVEGLIDQAVDLVLVQLPEQFDSKHYDQVSRAITLQTAILIESSDYAESNEPDAARKERMLATVISALRGRIQQDYEERYADDALMGPVLV